MLTCACFLKNPGLFLEFLDFLGLILDLCVFLSLCSPLFVAFGFVVTIVTSSLVRGSHREIHTLYLPVFCCRVVY